jgi:TPP-dependent pyruvate/acetoin dehydrogenase alpha subunit
VSRSSVAAEPVPAPPTSEHIYRAMLRGRRFDELALALQRQGAIDTYAEAKGQEGAQVGAVLGLESGDMVFPSYRQPSVALERGVSPVELLRQYVGASFCPWDWRRLGYAPYTIPVGSQTAHAVGWAWASRLRGEPHVCLVFFGDGAASQGEVHEAMNYAGVFGVPVVFFLENNGWAISLPAAQQTRAEQLVSRATGYGIAGVRVDGNDVLAVRTVVADARELARSGRGPTLVEAVTYRIGGHTTSDDPRRYRLETEVAEWQERDPLKRFRASLDETAGVTGRLDEIERAVAAEFDHVVDEWMKERGRV